MYISLTLSAISPESILTIFVHTNSTISSTSITESMGKDLIIDNRDIIQMQRMYSLNDLISTLFKIVISWNLKQKFIFISFF